MINGVRRAFILLLSVCACLPLGACLKADVDALFAAHNTAYLAGGQLKSIEPLLGKLTTPDAQEMRGTQFKAACKAYDAIATRLNSELPAVKEALNSPSPAYAQEIMGGLTKDLRSQSEELRESVDSLNEGIRQDIRDGKTGLLEIVLIIYEAVTAIEMTNQKIWDSQREYRQRVVAKLDLLKLDHYKDVRPISPSEAASKRPIKPD